MSNKDTVRNLNHLNKMLSKIFPKKKKAKNLFPLFSIITCLGLLGVFLSSFFIKEIQWKDIALSISSGLFASGLFATAVEWINIRNRKTLVKMKLSELKYFCSNYIDFISDELFDIDESHTYYEWVDILLNRYKKDKTLLFGISSRIDEIVKSALYFYGNEYDDFNNSLPNKQTMFEIKRLVIMCKSIKNVMNSSTNNEESLSKYLKVRIPSVILGVFPDLSDKFNKKTSYEKDE